MSIISLILTTKNNIAINSIDTNYNYSEDEKGNVTLILNDGKKVYMQFYKEEVKVVNSYQLKDRKEKLEVALFIKHYVKKKEYKVKRDILDLYGEYRLHNILYSCGYKTESTGDADLDYIRDKRQFVNLVSKVIGWIGI